AESHVFNGTAITPSQAQPCSETSSVFIIRTTAQRYGALVIIFVTYLAGEADLRPWISTQTASTSVSLKGLNASYLAPGLPMSRPNRIRRNAVKTPSCAILCGTLR